MSLVEGEDPLAFISMAKMRRSSIDSTGSRMSVPSIARNNVEQDHFMMHDFLVCRDSAYQEINVDVVEIKDEASYRKLFDDASDQEGDDNTENSTNYQMDMSNGLGNISNQFGSFNESHGSYQCQDCSYTNPSEDTLTVDDVLKSSLKKDVQISAIGV